jgi:hypothetical protein
MSHLTRLSMVVILSLLPICSQAANTSEASKPTLQCLTVELSTIARAPGNSCDEICAEHGAVCVAPISISTNPPQTCAAEAIATACRCCTITDKK